MICKSALTTILLGASLFAAESNIVHDAEDYEQPAVIQFHGVTEQDEVRVDGELVPAKGLARMNYDLLIAPGEYVVAVRLSGATKDCVLRVKLTSGQNIRPKCISEPGSQMAD